MVKKTTSIMIVLLMLSPLLMLTGVMPQSTIVGTLNVAPESTSDLAVTDLNRVSWKANLFPNRGMEEWYSPYGPENLYTIRTTEEASWYESTIVYEGAQSFGMHARAIDPSHNSEVRLIQQNNTYWSNPLNTTLDFEVYLDEIGNPIDQDYYRLHVRISNREMYYYIGCEITGATNGSTGYFMLDVPLQTWNHIHRNLTSDYIAVFGLEPLQFQFMEWYVRSYTSSYTRVYMDDVNLVNGTTVKVGGSIFNGNFEGTGDWTFQTSTDPADVSQSSVRHEGSWSMNMTVLSNDYVSYANAGYQSGKILSTSNQGQLSFWWRIDDWINPTTNNYARLTIQASNETTDFIMYYYLAVGGSGTMPPIMGENYLKQKADSFNVTNAWNHFDRNIWQDLSSSYTVENLWINEIEIEVRTAEDNSRLSILIDDISFVTSILNDMDYEHQNEPGTSILGWGFYPGPDNMTVTDFALSGTKAANLSLLDNQQIDEYQSLGYLPINSDTELILDFNVYIDTFNETSEDYVFFELEFDGEYFSYVIANSTDNFESAMGEEGEYFILLQDTIVKGEWLNFQVDIVHDYERIFGSLPNTTISYIAMNAEAGTGSQLIVLFDEVYIYYDPAPDVNNVHHTLTYAPGGGPATAHITAIAIDATLNSVSLNFRVDNGTVQSIAMSHIAGSTYAANIANLVGNRIVEYAITATDAFGKSTTALNGTDYYRFSVSTEGLPQGDLLGPLLIVGVILAIGVVFLVYVFIIRKK